MQVVSVIVGVLLCGGLLALIVFNTIGIVKNVKARMKSKSSESVDKKE